MLKRLFCCLSLLLSLCLLFPVFSVSISAISVDGYEVSTYVDTEDLADFVEFENTIVLDSSSDHLLVLFDIEFPEVISKDTVFDLEVSFSLGDFESIEPFISGSAYDAAGNELNNDLYAVIEDGKLIESDIVAEGDIKSIRYVFVIYNPSFNDDNVDSSTDIVTDLTGTTWKFGEYLVSEYTTSFSYSINCNIEMLYNDTSSYGTGDSINLYVDSGNYYFGTPVRFENYEGSYINMGNFYYGYKKVPRIDSRFRTNFEGCYYTFTGGADVTNLDLISWLQSNATLQSTNNSSSQYTFDFAVTSINVTKEDDAGVIGGIFGWIKKIFNAIRNLPNQIGDLIKGLFVPSEEAIIELKDKFEALLADRFGAAYQSIEVVDQFGQAMGISTYSDTKSTITIPSVSVPLAGTVFTFGGWEVDIVPKGFESLVISLKLITDLVCTVAFLNALRRRMEAILR